MRLFYSKNSPANQIGGGYLYEINKLLIHFCPRVFERYGAVEYQVVGRRVLIHIEITDALELQVIQRFRLSQELLNVALGKHGE